ncbi:hypothetical protein [Streptomyces sp. NPDC002785]|uniref:hypothetical protein n=1 Tax=Streptomyces sp. NPDC002785 TaxID=3154543 RepID=UPI00332E665F
MARARPAAPAVTCLDTRTAPEQAPPPPEALQAMPLNAACAGGEAGRYVRTLPSRRDSGRKWLVIEDEHGTIGKVEAGTHFDLDDYQQGYGDGVQMQLRELLVDEMLSNEEDEDEEQLDRALLFARLREGEPAFRANDATAR